MCCKDALPNHPFGSVTSSGPYTTGTASADPLIRTHAMHWVLSQEVYSIHRRESIEGFMYNPDASTDDMAIYSLDDHTIAAFRGTVNLTDVRNDFQLAMRGASCSFDKVKPAVEAIRAYMQQYPNQLVQTTGHSLGGAVARCVGQELGLGIITFNAAAPPSSPVRTRQNELDYHIAFDVISAWTEPTTIRIDKGYRPVKPPRFVPAVVRVWFFGKGVKPLLDAHKLENFSNERPGTKISNQDEDLLWHEWFNNLPRLVKATFLSWIQSRDLPVV